MEATIKFKVGQTVTCRSACDYNCIFSWDILARTVKTITVTDGYATKRIGIKVNSEGVETAKPYGNYSMAPVVFASENFSSEVAA